MAAFPPPYEHHHKSKREQKRELLRAAQKINPAIKTVKGAKKLDRKLTREAKAGVR